MMPNCCQGVPWNSGFIRCSIAHTTKPVKKKKARLVIQRVLVSGCRKIHMLPLESFFSTTIIDSPVSVKGIVKATLFILLIEIVVSPTMTSAFCNSHCQLLFTEITSKFSNGNIKNVYHVCTNLFKHLTEKIFITDVSSRWHILVGHRIG